MPNVKFFSGENIPLEMHKVRMVQRVYLNPIEERANSIKEAGYNTFLLRNRDIFLDMLTDSGVNAMSENQYASMLQADDSYAGSETYYRLESVLQDMFNMQYFLPAHQGRACEHIIAKLLVTPGSTAVMNYHFTTTKAHICMVGGEIEEIIIDEGLQISSELPFKGNLDIEKLKASIARLGKDKICFVRIEAGTNLVGGQPVSMDNMREVSKICRAEGLTLVYDASLLSDNLYFIKTRDPNFKDTDIREITREIGSMMDIIYFSARKLGAARGGGILTSNNEMFMKMREMIPLYEGFLTYGGMSVREMEAMAIGLQESMDMDIISQTPIFVEVLCKELLAKGVPVVTPPGGLGCHVDARQFCEHIPQEKYPAGALAAAFYLCSGVRGMERGTLSEQRNPDGSETLAHMELLRLAFPKRVFTLSQVKYVADRLTWLYENRKLIGGLTFEEEPRVLRFFFGRLKPLTNWPDELLKKFRADFGESL
ncbi:MAG: tryptophanase [Defluviitaleaceae bacterium]|nr:tryptophanase [Defluviitaleaceae bacterium]MCL2261608.1 tryptophanase [Defluviitaleaceae bacterium]